MTDYVWKSDDGQYAVKGEPQLKHENVEFDAVFVPEPHGAFRALYRCDAKAPTFHRLGAVDKTKEQGAKAALRTFAKLRAKEIESLQKEAKRRRELRQGGR